MAKYDVVITGSGLSGLVCGSILAKNGLKVCILEKNSLIGGCLQSFKRRGVVFDTGVHYIGSLDKGQILEKSFNYLGLMDVLNFTRMNSDAYDIISFGSDGKEFHHAVGYDKFQEILTAEFPNEKNAIKKYCETLRRVNDSFSMNTSNTIPDSVYFTTSTIAFLKSITDNEKLQSVLAGSNLLYAGVSDRTPMYIHALVNHSYIESAYKIVNGSGQIADFLADFIENNSGKILLNHEVTRYVHNDSGLIIGALTSSGDIVEGDKFISCIHPSLTVGMIDNRYIRKPYAERLANLENTISVFGLYAVMKENSFPYKESNYYHYRNDNVWTIESYDEAVWPENFFLSVASPTDDGKWARGVNVLCYMKYDEVEKWNDTSVGKRGDDYKAFKEKKAQALIKLIEERFPGFSGMIDSYYTSTPLTYRDYTATVRGSMYGIFHDSKDFMRSHLSVKTKIPNLFLAGQNVSLHGVLGVTINSIVACGSILGLDSLMQKIGIK